MALLKFYCSFAWVPYGPLGDEMVKGKTPQNDHDDPIRELGAASVCAEALAHTQAAGSSEHDPFYPRNEFRMDRRISANQSKSWHPPPMPLLNVSLKNKGVVLPQIPEAPCFTFHFQARRLSSVDETENKSRERLSATSLLFTFYPASVIEVHDGIREVGGLHRGGGSVSEPGRESKPITMRNLSAHASFLPMGYRRPETACFVCWKGCTNIH